MKAYFVCLRAVLCRTQLLLLFAVLYLSACGGGGGGGSSFSFSPGNFSLTSERARVPAQVGEFITVDVGVNGVQARFILDTGADSFVVSNELATQAGLTEVGTATLATIAGVSQVPIFRIRDFRMANVIGSEIDAVVVPLDGFDGIVGLPFPRALPLPSFNNRTGAKCFRHRGLC